MTNIALTDEQAALFVLFMKHYDNLGYMFQQGVFDIRDGNAILNFTTDGFLRSIKKELFVKR